VFAPNIADGPSLSQTAPDIEVILSLKPDVVITYDKPTLTKLEESKEVPVIWVEFKGADEIKTILKLIGEVFGDTERANKTIQYFDNKINEINAKVSSIPLDKRPKVLYGEMSTLTAIYFTSEWCIDKAGGIPVSANNRVEMNYQFNMEQLLTWNPDIILVRKPDDITYVNSHSEFSSINAVKNKQVYLTPACMGNYGGSSPEMPMAVEWMASKFYPDLFSESQVRADIVSFYKEFYEYELSDSQVDEILRGLY
jgi:iron complex transport system substrate-binding protein